MKTPISTIMFAIITPIVTHASSTGIITVVGEDPVALQINVPSSTPYKLAYDAGRLSVWDTVTRDNLIAPNTELTAPAVKGDFEPDCDTDLNDFGGFQRCFGGGPLGLGCDVFDIEPDIDVDLTDFAALEQNMSGPETCVPVRVTVFVEGLTASAALGDVSIDVLSDPDGDTIFTLQSTQPVTVVSIGVAPPSGPLGTVVTFTMQPAIAPIAFDGTTTAVWQGVYQPLVGSATSPFQLALDASQFRESSASLADIIVGDATVVGACPDVRQDSGGSLDGALSFELGSTTLSKTFSFGLSLSDTFRTLIYPEDGSGLLPGAPTVGSVAAPLVAANIPTGVSAGAFLDNPSLFHLALAIIIDDNPSTVANAPATITVDVVSLSGGGVELDRLVNVVLTPLANDGDPDHVTYTSDLNTPIILVDGPVNDADFPTLLLMQVVTGGEIFVVQCID